MVAQRVTSSGVSLGGRPVPSKEDINEKIVDYYAVWDYEAERRKSHWEDVVKRVAATVQEERVYNKETVFHALKILWCHEILLQLWHGKISSEKTFYE